MAGGAVADYKRGKRFRKLVKMLKTPRAMGAVHRCAAPAAAVDGDHDRDACEAPLPRCRRRAARATAPALLLL